MKIRLTKEFIDSLPLIYYDEETKETVINITSIISFIILIIMAYFIGFYA